MSDKCLENNDSVTLRAIEPEDLDMLYTVENDVSSWNTGTTNVPYSRYMLHDYIANASNDIYVDRQVRFIVQWETTPIGIADVVNFEPQHLRAEIGIVIQTKYRDHGFARQALQQLISYAKNVVHLHQLYAMIAVDNSRSLSLFSSLGFISGGTLKDWLFDGSHYHDTIMMQLFL
jgi:diamine N-acetyltransferase